jgi:hypothetical protein
MNPRPIETNGQSLTPEQLAVAAELQAYAARVAPRPSFAFADKVMAATANSPLPVAPASPRVPALGFAGAIRSRLSVAFAQAAGGPAIPLKVRLQAGALLVALGLLVTVGAAAAAQGAVSVVNWVAPQVPFSVGPPPWVHQPTNNTTPAAPGETAHSNGTDHPGNGVKPSDPGAQSSGHPSSTDHPGNGSKPTDPGAQSSGHPSSTDHPGDGRTKPTKAPKPT